MKLKLKNTSTQRVGEIELTDEHDVLEQVALITGDLVRAHSILNTAREVGKVIEKVVSPSCTIWELTLENVA